MARGAEGDALGRIGRVRPLEIGLAEPGEIDQQAGARRNPDRTDQRIFYGVVVGLGVWCYWSHRILQGRVQMMPKRHYKLVRSVVPPDYRRKLRRWISKFPDFMCRMTIFWGGPLGKKNIFISFCAALCTPSRDCDFDHAALAVRLAPAPCR